MSPDLWPHQTDGLAEIRRSLMAGARHPILCIPTGGGKTKLAAAIVRMALAKGNRVVFVVPAISLIDQTVTAFGKEGITQVGVMQADHPLTNDMRPVQIASVQTLARRTLPNTELVIVDEVHVQFKVIERWMAERPDIWFIGLSATPWARGLGKHWDDLIVAATTQELIDATPQVLVPFRVWAPTHPDLSGVRTAKNATGDVDYVETELADVMGKAEIVADVVGTWMQRGENRPTLCFAVNRAHARQLEHEFEMAGVSVAYIDAFTGRDDRQKIGEALEAGRIKVVVNIGTLTTGVDWDVRCLILARPTKSEMLYVQIIGRALRAVRGKTDAIILDHSDTTLRLGFVTDIHHDRLDDGQRRESKAASPKERPAATPKECTACHYVKPAGVHECPECGFAPVHREDVTVVEGDLVQMSGKKLEADRATKQRFWSGLLWYVDNKGKSEKWAAHRYRNRFGVWPRSLSARVEAPDVHCRNWVKAEAIKWAKGQEKARAAAAAVEGASNAA